MKSLPVKIRLADVHQTVLGWRTIFLLQMSQLSILFKGNDYIGWDMYNVNFVYDHVLQSGIWGLRVLKSVSVLLYRMTQTAQIQTFMEILIRKVEV